MLKSSIMENTELENFLVLMDKSAITRLKPTYLQLEDVTGTSKTYSMEELTRIDPRLQVAIPEILKSAERNNQLTFAGINLLFTLQHWFPEELGVANLYRTKEDYRLVSFDSTPYDRGSRSLNLTLSKHCVELVKGNDGHCIPIVTGIKVVRGLNDGEWLDEVFPGWEDRLKIAKSLSLELREQLAYIFNHNTVAISPSIDTSGVNFP